MLNVKDELKLVYKNDMLPVRNGPVKKELLINFPELDLTVNNTKIVSESFELTESLCSDTDLKFGACEAAQVKITLADTDQDLTGQTCIITQVVNDQYVMPLGTYTVDSAKRQDDLRFKDIVALDGLTRLNTDVADWYNGLSFPLTLRAFRQSFFAHVGLIIEDQNLPNDDMIVTKTIQPATLNGRDVAQAVGEINGRFGHMTRQNQFKYIGLSGLGLYPSETLYPSEDLYPSEPGEILGSAGYKSCRYEEYTVRPIDKLQIRQEEGDIGCVVGDGNNPYIVQGNFLVYGKGASELEEIANNLFRAIKNKYYRPHTTVIPGLPYLEVGDAISIVKNNDVIESFVFSRTLCGIQALEDEISATGNESRDNRVDANTEIQQLKGKTLKIVKSVDEMSVTMADMEERTQSQLKQTADSITAEVTRATEEEETLRSSIRINADSIVSEVSRAQGEESRLSSTISQTAGQIDLKVDKDGVIGAINLSSEQATISADKINLNGYVTVTDLSTGGKTTVNGSNITTGTIDASKVNVSNLKADSITSGTLNAGKVAVTNLSADSITSGSLDCGRIVAGSQKLLTYANQSLTIGPGASGYFSGLSLNSSNVNIGYGGNGGVNIKSATSTTSEVDIKGYTVDINGTGTGIKMSGKVGFFGTSPQSKSSVQLASTSGTLANTINTLNNLISALRSYGLV